MSSNYYDAENDTLTRIAGSTRPVDVMVGASSSAAGSSGKVPAPSAGDQDKVLHGDGSWRAVSHEDLTLLETASTNSLVAAINELNSRLAAIENSAGGDPE